MGGRNKPLYVIIVLSIAVMLLTLLYVFYSKKEYFQEESPKNIAVVFSGRIRGYTYIEQKLEDLQNKYNATFFISLNKNERSQYIDTFCKKFKIGDEQAIVEKTISPEWIRSFDVVYNVSGGKESDSVDNVYSMVKNKDSVFKLIGPYEEKHNVKFDCILFYRADIDSHETMSITVPQENTVYIPEGADHYGINDQVAYGNYDTMKKYSELVNNLQKLCGEHRITYHSETLLKHHLENEGLNIVRFPFNYSLHPKRHEYMPEYDYTP